MGEIDCKASPPRPLHRGHPSVSRWRLWDLAETRIRAPTMGVFDGRPRWRLIGHLPVAGNSVRYRHRARLRSPLQATQQRMAVLLQTSGSSALGQFIWMPVAFHDPAIASGGSASVKVV